MTTDFRQSLKSQLVGLVALLAGARFLVVSAGSILHQTTLPDALAALPGWQLKWAPLVDRAALLGASLLLMLLIPRLIAARSRRLLGRLDEFLALASLAFPGALAVNALARTPWSLTLAGAIVAVLFGAGALRLSCSHAPWLKKGPTALLFLAAVFPLLWRCTLAGGTLAADDTLLAWLRQVADISLLSAWPLMALAAPGPRKRALTWAALLACLALAGWGLGHERLYLHILSNLSGLWFSTLSPWLAVVLSVLGAFALLRHVLSHGNGPVTFALILLASSGHQPQEVATLMFQALAAVALIIHFQKGARQGRGMEDLLN